MFLRLRCWLVVFGLSLSLFLVSPLLAMMDTEDIEKSSVSPPIKKQKSISTSSNRVPIKMGIELELQEITVNLPNITLPDHIRVFESSSSSSGNPDWYLEVDGAGNLEFVSRPFDLQDAEENISSHPLYKALKDMNQLMAFILENASMANKEGIPYLCFKIPERANFLLGQRRVGVWNLKFQEENLTGEEITRLNQLKEITIDIKDPTCQMRPQATFELPMVNLSAFCQYMAPKHRKLEMALRKLNAMQVKTPAEGLWYLVRLYIEFLKDKKMTTELGPKGKLPLMSRASFSKMYSLLNDKQPFNRLCEQFNGVNAPLFGTTYSLFYEDKDLAKTHKNVADEITGLTVRQWTDSIRKPQITRAKRERYREAWREVAEGKDTPEMELNRKQIKLGLYDRGTDYLSPPPYLHNTYSMGKNDEFENPNYTIIEMRGYTANYSNNMRMGPLAERWLAREIDSARLTWNRELLNPILQSQYDNNLNEYKKSLSQFDRDDQTFTDLLNAFKAPLKALKLSPDSKWQVDKEGINKNVDKLTKMLLNNNKNVMEEIIEKKREWALENLFKD